MSEKEEFTEDLKVFESQLASLVPRTDRLDRERLMFLAGQQSVMGNGPACAAGAQSRRSRHLAWPVAFSAMTAVAVVLGVMLSVRPEPKPIVRFVKVPVAVPAEESQQRPQ